MLIDKSGKVYFSSWKKNKKFIYKKEAINRKFSFAGLLLSLFIAFFIVFISAQILHNIYLSMQKDFSKKEKLNFICYFFEIKKAKAENNDYQGNISKWTDYLKAEAGKDIIYTATFTNKGNKIWKKNKVFLETGPSLRRFSKFKHSKWLKYYRLGAFDKDVLPGEKASIKFYLNSPDKINGTIQENFQLVFDNKKPILGTELRLFITLESKDIYEDKVQQNKTTQELNKSNAFITLKKKEKTKINIKEKKENKKNLVNKVDFCIALSKKEKEKYVECQTNLIENDTSNGISQDIQYKKEPIIRIGLFNTKKAQRVTCDDYYDVYAGKNLLLSALPANYLSVVSFNKNSLIYTVSTKGISKKTKFPIRFVPRNKNRVMTLLDFDNRPKWNKKLNYNQYRNIIEFRYSVKTKKLWVINELPISYYIKGLAETSNYSPLDYQKAIATIARTYALYHYNRGQEYNLIDASTKHSAEHFHLDAIYDQVYKGYGSEQLLTRLSQAVEETKGVAVTYNNKIVVTPYFSRSDGRTRSWEEVWYGNPKPWLKSVAVPEDKGQSLWGHGVGLSARGALIMIRDKMMPWIDTLKHFYTKISLKKVY